jgi:hypothetical protein
MRRAVIAFAVAGAVAVAVSWPLGLQGWLAVHTGTVNEPGPYYGFFSGFGSDLSELALLAGVGGLLRRYNCHVHGCWRVGRHPVEGTPFTVCRHHHPDGHVTAADVRKRYHLYLGGKPGRG